MVIDIANSNQDNIFGFYRRTLVENIGQILITVTEYVSQRHPVNISAR